ncbi:MAG: hypothetical protein U1G07_04685 [Verrucomicrobiota bacterium]
MRRQNRFRLYRSRSGVRTVLLPAAGVLLFLLVGYHLWTPPQHPSPLRAVAPPVQPVQKAAVEPAASEPDPSQLLTWTESFDQPLETELSCVVSDAKAALKSLTESFLPTTLVARSDF